MKKHECHWREKCQMISKILREEEITEKTKLSMIRDTIGFKKVYYI